MKGFISYAHADMAVCDALCKHLKAIERAYGFEFWIDKRNTTGRHFDQAVEDAIAAANVYILLTSSNSLWTDLIMDWELPAINKKQRADGDLVLTVVVDNCRWEGITGTLLASPRDDRLNLKPIKNWHRQNQGLNRVRTECEAAIRDHFGAVPKAAFQWKSK